jgi:hypothetical protein
MLEFDEFCSPVLVRRPVLEGSSLLCESRTTRSSDQERQSKQAPMLISSFRVKIRTETLIRGLLEMPDRKATPRACHFIEMNEIVLICGESTDVSQEIAAGGVNCK